ncbi:Fic family protein [Raineyella sp. LH-20]|uniref:Fic family protein n=1 Tax=Raineyella sp. LH-20 TaxID=3081204 RepID=UPI00295392B0|nr:Fic family protein [Raineyella sp. LH-20]WOP18840.1 Fic family protein [Raineyella sp. LH-20]
MSPDHGGAIDPVVTCAVGHYMFEALHPFHDGNGRLGRLLGVLTAAVHPYAICSAQWEMG